MSVAWHEKEVRDTPSPGRPVNALSSFLAVSEEWRLMNVSPMRSLFACCDSGRISNEQK